MDKIIYYLVFLNSKFSYVKWGLTDKGLQPVKGYCYNSRQTEAEAFRIITALRERGTTDITLCGCNEFGDFVTELNCETMVTTTNKLTSPSSVEELECEECGYW